MAEARHIPVVDDDADFGRTVAAYLTKEGYRLDAVANGAGKALDSLDLLREVAIPS